MPCRTWPASGDDEAVAMPDRDPTVTVRVVAAIPLLQAALEHAVTAAGLRLVFQGEAVATLRTPDRPAIGASVDISVNMDQVTIVLAEPPSPDVWKATLNLIRQLFDNATEGQPFR